MKKHTISFVLACGTILLFFHLIRCGKIPSSLPLPYTGSINITASATNASFIDSIMIELDDQDYGCRENPCLLDDIIVGLHKLCVQSENSTPKTQTIEVFRDEITMADFSLSPENPYIGINAPLFVAQDVNGNTVSLEDLRGKVVLLVFFEYT